MSSYFCLINNINRAEASYKIYCKIPNYHHAMHILHANEKIYSCLNLLLEDPKHLEHREEIFNYLFHLEDWFLQFRSLEKGITDLEQEFKFMPLENAIAYPKCFLRTLES